MSVINTIRLIYLNLFIAAQAILTKLKIFSTFFQLRGHALLERSNKKSKKLLDFSTWVQITMFRFSSSSVPIGSEPINSSTSLSCEMNLFAPHVIWWFRFAAFLSLSVSEVQRGNTYVFGPSWAKMVNHRIPSVFSKTYVTPRRPFEKPRLDAELKIIGQYGLRNKREVWRVKYTLAKIRKAARELLTLEEKDEKRLFQGKF